ncbi:MAG TPA: hypothetical protein VF765_25840 [Polyangiaceae bacterium]
MQGPRGSAWRSHARKRLRRGAFLGALALASPGFASRAAADPPPGAAAPAPAAPAGNAACAKDTDCKGDQVCDAGRCIEPRSAATFAYGPTPTDSASGGPPVSARDLRVNASLLEATAYNAQTLQANHQGCDATISGGAETVTLRQRLAETCNRWVDSEAMWNQDDAWSKAAPTASTCRGSAPSTAPTSHRDVCGACTEPLDATIAALRADAARLRTMASVVDCTVSGGAAPVVAPITQPQPAPVPPTVAATPTQSPVPPPPPPPSRTQVMVSKVGLVGGAVLTFVGFYLLVDDYAKSGLLDSVCVKDWSSGNSACPQSAAGAISDYNNELLWGAVTSLVGVGMLVVGWLTHPTYTAPSNGAASILVGPGGMRGKF